MFKQALQY